MKSMSMNVQGVLRNLYGKVVVEVVVEYSVDCTLNCQDFRKAENSADLTVCLFATFNLQPCRYQSIPPV